MARPKSAPKTEDDKLVDELYAAYGCGVEDDRKSLGQPSEDWPLSRIKADPEGWFAATKDELRRKNPQMTDAQLRAEFEQARDLLL